MQQTNGHEVAEVSSDRESDPRYWINKCKRYEEVFKARFWNAAKEGWAEYQLSDDEGGASEAGTGEKVSYAKYFPIYWSSIKTLAPAYYSKTPIPVAPVRYGMTDPIARTGSKAMERLGIYSLEVTPFDEVIRDAVMEFIISDVVTTRVMLEADEVEQSFPVSKGEDGTYRDDAGNPYEGEVEEGEEGASGYRTGYENHECYPMALSYDDVMWTPGAACFDEIEEKMYRFCYPEQEAYEMFPGVDEATLKGAMKVYGRKDSAKDYEHKKEKSEGTKDLFLHGWEIWCKKNKMVYFVCPEIETQILKSSPDTYHLRNFFPSPCPIVGTKQRKSLFGVPSIRYLKPLIEQLHSLAVRSFKLSKSMRRRFVVAKEHEAQVRKLIEDADESEYIFIKNLMEIVEKGGLQNVIQALPVGDLSQALVEISNLFEKFKAEFNEIYGVPDVIRGVSDPIETAKSQEIKSFSATNRFRDQMNQIAGLARDTLELLIDLKLGAYPPEQIARICGYQWMEPEDQQRFPQAYALITDDEERIVRIDIETDSTSYINEMIEQSNRNVAIQTVTQGLAAVNGMPPLQQAIGFKTIQSALAGMRLGKEFMDDIDELMGQMMEEAKNPAPPPPDPEMMKIQIEQQKLQLQAQQSGQKSQLEQMSMAMKQQEANTKAQLQAQKQQIDAMIAGKEASIKEFEAAIRAETERSKESREMASQAMDQVVQQFNMKLDSVYLILEQMKTQAQIKESQLEELRLAKQQEVDTLKTVIDMERSKNEGGREPIVVPAPEMPPIYITNEIPGATSRKKRGSIVRDPKTGNAQITVEEFI